MVEKTFRTPLVKESDYERNYSRNKDCNRFKIQCQQNLEVDQAQATVGKAFCENPKMSMRDVNVFYGDKQAIYDVSVDIAKNEVIAMIGPSG